MKVFSQQKRLNNKGFSLVELAVILAVLAVLLTLLAPSLLRYVENSRMQKDDSAMDEVCHSVQLAMADSETFDEVCSYAIPNNYVTYSDSSGTYGAKFTDEEFWAPDGSGNAVTITFNPDGNGNYDIAQGLVNNMTLGNGSTAETRVVGDIKQCTLEEMGNKKLYSALKKTIGNTLSEKSATYNNSSYTVFIKLEVVNGIKRANVYGEWNGTNLSPDCPAAVGSGTSDYTDKGEAIVTKPAGGTQAPQYSNSDLSGGGSTGNNTPGLPPQDSEEKKTTTLRFGEPYGLKIDNSDGGSMYYVYTFFKNGSASFNLVINGNIEESEIAPSGMFSYTDTNILSTDDSSVLGTILDDGTKIEIDGEILILGLVDVCVHENTELRNVTGGYTGDIYCIDCGRCMGIGYCNHTNIELRDAINGYSGDKYCADCGELLEKGGYLIPEGGTYYIGVQGRSSGDYSTATKILKAGDFFPSYVSRGDVYVYGDYEYRYGIECSYNDIWYSGTSHWGVDVLDKTKTTYGPMLETICSKPITGLGQTFFGCSNMTTIPKLPSTVEKLDGTFYGCSNLVTYEGSTDANGDFSNFVIPSNVKWLQSTFGCCQKMVKAPRIPEGVTSVYKAFICCTNLTTVPTLPDSVTSLDYVFSECYKISTYYGSADSKGDFSNYVIPSRVTRIAEMFSFSNGLKKAPRIHSNITDISKAFYGTGLIEAPVIPETVTYVGEAFGYCHNLTETINLPCSLANAELNWESCPATVTYYHVGNCNGSCGK